MIPVNHNSKLAEIVTEFIVRTRASLDANRGLLQGRTDREAVTDFITAVEKHTGLIIGVELSGNINSVNLGIGSRILFTGHNSTRFTTGTTVRDRLANIVKLPELLDLTVDLKHLKISGTFPKNQSHMILIPVGLFNPRYNFTTPEIIAMILHEFGHMFSTYINMGDYVWLNFYLTEGLEVLQGHKRSKIKSELFNAEWLSKNLSKEELGNFIYGQTDPEAAKRVALIASRRLPRHHLTDNPLTAMLREEQFADMFATRLGYGKDLAKAVFNLRRLLGEHVVETGKVRAIANGLIILASIPLLPLLAITTVFERLPEEHLTDPIKRYDNDKERLNKLRRDLIFQMKQNEVDVLTTIEDIKVIDLYIKQILDNRTYYQTLVTFFRPSIRKAEHNKKTEELLESLVNNNLFIDTHRV